MPLDAELADLRGFLASRGVDHPPERLAETFRPRGSRLTAGDDVVLVRSGVVGADDVVADDALLLVRPTTRPDTALRLLALDVETTGLVPGRDRVVSWAGCRSTATGSTSPVPGDSSYAGTTRAAPRRSTG